MLPAVAGNAILPVVPNAPAVQNVAPNPSLATIGRLPTQSVPSTLSTVESRNNFRGNVVTPDQPALVENDIAQQQDATPVSNIPTGGETSGGFSSSFAAQLIAQNPDVSGLTVDSTIFSVDTNATGSTPAIPLFTSLQYGDNAQETAAASRGPEAQPPENNNAPREEVSRQDTVRENAAAADSSARYQQASEAYLRSQSLRPPEPVVE